MGPLLIMAIFLIALVVNNVLLTERCHRLESMERSRNELLVHLDDGTGKYVLTTV